MERNLAVIKWYGRNSSHIPATHRSRTAKVEKDRQPGVTRVRCMNKGRYYVKI